MAKIAHLDTSSKCREGAREAVAYLRETGISQSTWHEHPTGIDYSLGEE